MAKLEVEESPDCVDLLASLDCGLLPLLDKVSGRLGASGLSYMKMVQQWQGLHQRLTFSTERPLDFMVRHCGGLQVTYSAADFIEANRTSLTNDMVRMFRPEHCSSGFLCHLFSCETKLSSSSNRSLHGLTPGPMERGRQPSLARSMHQQVDALLRRLLASSSSFLLCIWPSQTKAPRLSVWGSGLTDQAPGLGVKICGFAD